MPRPRKPPRLYLDPERQRWVIRDGPKMKRTRYREHQIELATIALNRYIRTRAWRLERSIYFVTCDAPDFPIKIGMSGNVEERLRDIRTALPFEPVLMASFTGTSKDETAVHGRFAHLRLRGEWFRRDAALVDWIENAGWNVPQSAPKREPQMEAAALTL